MVEQITNEFTLVRRLSIQKVLEFIQVTSLFDSEIYIIKHEKAYNLKSVLGVMNLFFTSTRNQTFIVRIKGEDAEYANKEIKKFINTHS
ncbi:HPr family phosphocarrier protein [Alteribacter aurantiacus]|uniref:HPr family phosphocarrier protein n=1 Tax=Alteribacter aurantiacus TaxID=254410 RepID=UPI0004103AFF|nr:HPr family phosphocarrier protein [Alteribacter aurantiacus]